MEEQDNSEDQEVATQELEQDGSVQDVEESGGQEVEQAAESKQDRNWRAMERSQKELEWQLKQRDEMLNRFMQMNPAQQQVQAQEPEEAEIPDDDYPSAGGVKGIARKTVKPLEKKLQDLEAKFAQQEQSNLLGSLRVKFPDFDDVVNIETLQMLEQKEPELASTIEGLKDPYKIGIQSYKYIKALGLVDSLPDQRRTKEVEKKIEKNAKSVPSPMAFDKRPMAQAFKSTATDQKRLYKEMMHYAGQCSGF